VLSQIWRSWQIDQENDWAHIWPFRIVVPWRSTVLHWNDRLNTPGLDYTESSKNKHILLLKECNLVQNDQIDSYMTRPNNTRAVKCSSIFLFITFAKCNLLIGVDVRLLRLLIEIFNASYNHRIGRYSRSVTQASICPRFYKQFFINHAILASTTGTLYLPKPDKNFRLY
jgi:hypothetical protein